MVGGTLAATVRAAMAVTTAYVTFAAISTAGCAAGKPAFLYILAINPMHVGKS
jgi:hypothetical protein